MNYALKDKSAEEPRPPKRRRRWLRYSLRGLFVLVFLTALPGWWIRSQLDGFAAEHEAIELLRSQGATVHTKPAEPEWLWKNFPGGTTPPLGASGQADSGASRREQSEGDAANGWRGGAPDRGEQTRRDGSSGDAPRSQRSRRRWPSWAQHAGTKPADAPASRKPRNMNNPSQSGPALMFRQHATGVVLPSGEGNDAQMKFIARLKDLEWISIYDGKITDAGLASCSSLRNLRKLDLDGCRLVSDDALAHLRRADKLESLQLNSTHIGDRGMAFVAELPALKWLLARDTEIGNNGLRQLARVESLECVALTGTNIDDEGIGELARCKKLRQLQLPIGVTAAGLAKLASLKELTMLAVSAGGQLPLVPFQKLEVLDVRLDEADDGTALAHLKRLQKLHRLSLEGDGITDATLRSLEGAIKRQCVITVRGGHISEASVRALAPSLPRGSALHLEESPLGYDASARLQRELLVNSIPVSLHVGAKSDGGWPSRRAPTGRRGFGGERGQAIEKRPTESDPLGATLDE